VVFVVLMVIGEIANRYEKKPSSDISGKSSQNGYVLNSAEISVLDSLLKNDAATLINGGDALLKRELLSVTSVKIAYDYSENQVAADQKYNDKQIFLSGQIQDINSGIGNEPYLLFYGVNQFLPVMAHFKDANVQKIAALKKGQKLNLVCIGNGAVIGAPHFKDCAFVDDYADERVVALKTEINDFLSGNGSSKISKVVIGAIAAERALPASSTCFSSGSQCINDIKKVSEQIKKEDYLAIADELNEKGVHITRAEVSEMLHR
jgi:hypothetical protein